MQWWENTHQDSLLSIQSLKDMRPVRDNRNCVVKRILNSRVIVIIFQVPPEAGYWHPSELCGTVVNGLVFCFSLLKWNHTRREAPGAWEERKGGEVGGLFCLDGQVPLLITLNYFPRALQTEWSEGRIKTYLFYMCICVFPVQIHGEFCTAPPKIWRPPSTNDPGVTGLLLRGLYLPLIQFYVGIHAITPLPPSLVDISGEITPREK